MRTLTWVAVVLGLLSLGGTWPAAAADQRGPSASAVSLESYSRSVAVGDLLALRGRTTAPRGTRVLIQRRVGSTSGFHTVQRTRVRQHGRITYVARQDTVGQYRLRACVRLRHRTCSRPMLVRVTEVASPEPRWYYLHDGGPAGAAAGAWCERPETVAGVLHEKSVAFGANCQDRGENYGEVALGGACTTFEAVVGLSDASTDDSRYDAHVRVDGVEVFAQAGLARGQAYAVSADLTGAQRLRLEGPFVAGRLGNVVFGGARVWCDF